MNRLTRTVAAALLASALTLVSACSSDSDASDAKGGDGKSLEKVTYLTSFGNFGRDSYAWVAKEKGFFKEAGFDVEIKPGQGTGAVIQTIVGGQADFGPIDLTGGLLQLGNGQAKDFVAVAAIQQRTMAAIVTVEGKNIASPKDLEGKKLADAPASVVRNLFPTYARLAGVDVNKVTWVNGEAQTLMGTLASGSVDGIGQFVVGQPTVEAVTKKKAVLLPYSNVMQDLYGNVLITSSKIAKEKPEMVKRFTAALMKGLEYSLANPQEAAELLKKNVDATNPAAAAAELQLMAGYVRSNNSGTKIGTLDSGRVAKSIAILQGAGSLKQNLTPDQIIDFSLVPQS
ncbi:MULTISPECIES: ABC transporter substrate-binding protein [Micromonospora]|jgi:NitT/TauT family transport system substrate-binding protein|uniref:ABC transporter substrate-binding protein n=1 Tax=Micromonospora carbonacea TaxID=47853 RepID=A0A7H8XTB4_9ACTN|nr:MULTISPECIES: ABC transporter substrate-binding protein [Micromonospora]MBB5824304.1 NitT/TauT family transport system substrate-binding protein [Micromonospora carbonacea]MDG4815461.1 ABC transporter substrate-binding protein [Micromonospora sp. WMMD956]QLD27479.1 ABC transporter substrate-binding protein [Micromonospora carbonacea]WFE58022.1 ABC transporter substrate-binding protein [Micromonospora sp. WMMD712]